MKPFVALASVLAVASARPQVTIQKVGYGPSQLVRAPAHDSASIESHRFGGNFAYSTAEAHAYASITPEISEATHPVAETTKIHEPASIARVQPAPIVKTHHVAQPIVKHEPILATQPVVGPVATHTEVHQPLQKIRTVHHQPAQVAYTQQVVAAEPVVAAAPAQVAYTQPALAPAAVAYAQPQGAYVQAPVSYATHAYAAGVPAIVA